MAKAFTPFTKKGGDTKPGNEASEPKKGVSPTELSRLMQAMDGKREQQGPKAPLFPKGK